MPIENGEDEEKHPNIVKNGVKGSPNGDEVKVNKDMTEVTYTSEKKEEEVKEDEEEKKPLKDQEE